MSVENRNHKWEKLKLAGGFATFSAAEAWATFFGPDKWRAHWLWWITLAGTIFFSFMTVMCLLAAYFDWSEEETVGAAYMTAALLIAGPILLGLILVIAVSLFWWFGSIPSWAAVIIVLLVLILVKNSRGNGTSQRF